MSCVFCDEKERLKPFWWGFNHYAFKDEFPCTVGHSILVPYDHVDSFFSKCWIDDVFRDVRIVAQKLRSEDPSITGFNIGINDGEDAGQTVMHAHLHIIPRRKRDCADPRGGIRLMFGEKGNYLK